MLAAVKTPHIEMALNAAPEALEYFLKVIREHFEVEVFTPDAVAPTVNTESDDEEFENFLETDLWKKCTPGNLLTGTRLKHQLTQKQLSEKTGISQVTISDYETGRRKLTRKAAYRLATAMGENPDSFFMAPNTGNIHK